jgi:omega-amidase
MKLTILQPDIIWEDKIRNLEVLGKMSMSVPPDTDILILPEMFNTGFSMNPSRLAEPPGSTTLEWMKDISVNHNTGVCGSYIIKRDGGYYNSWIFVSPEGEMVTYDKRHLFSPGNEDKLFKKGMQRIVFSFRGVRICPNICYDLRFPVWSRNCNDYDLLINSANWPQSRRDVWLTLLKARAIENQCYVVGANRTGTDGEGINYCGDSMVIGPKGEVIASVMDSVCFLTGEISAAMLSEFRRRFPAIKDADNFEIKY